MEEVATHLSNSIVNIVHLFNPEVIILSGEIVQDNLLFLQIVQDKVRNNVLPPLKGKINIQTTSLGTEFEMLGAAAILLKNKFNFDLIEKT